MVSAVWAAAHHARRTCALAGSSSGEYGADEMRHFQIRRALLAAALAFGCGLSSAATAPLPVRAEVDTLLTALAGSSCLFYRNGSWYTASVAKEHLSSKLKFFERGKTLQSTEQFIEVIASKSSMSGKPYRVKCGSDAPVESEAWLSQQLVSLRARSAREVSSAEPESAPQ